MHYVGEVDDTVETVESLGYDRAYVIGGAGIYDLFQPIIR
jgi:dihydrofolate reductase